jgi:hypothetical protein
MELQDIARLVYEATRVKEDRLLMKWEDDRCSLYHEIERLRDKNERLRQRVESSKEVIQRQKGEYDNLIQTVASFGTKTKTSPPSAPSLVPAKSAPVHKNNKKAGSTSSNSSSGKPAVPKYTTDGADDEFISIDRNKVVKKGPLHSFFSGHDTPQPAAPAPSLFASTTTATKARSDARRVSDASVMGGLWEHEANTEGDAGACEQHSFGSTAMIIV